MATAVLPPVPWQSVATPRLSSRVCSAPSRVTMMRAPVSADRMAEGHRAAVDVELVLRDPELLLEDHAVDREGLVVLEEVHVLDGQARALHQLAHGRDRRLRELVAGAGRPGAAEHAGDRRQAVGLHRLAGGQDQRRGAVADLAGVAGRQLAVLLEGGPQLRQALRRGVRADALVAVHQRAALAALDLDRLDLGQQRAALRGGGRPLVRGGRHRVDVFAGDAELRDEALGLVAHDLVGEGVRQARRRPAGPPGAPCGRPGTCSPSAAPCER